ncbi:MAG: phosphoribosyltransferase family protein [archaeon]
MDKLSISAQSLLEDSFLLAKRIYDDNFLPDFIVGIWRGGTPVGIAVQEFFTYKGHASKHIAIRTEAYEGIDCIRQEIAVYGLHYIIDTANAENSLLLVDDVFDSGRSIEAVISTLQDKMRRNFPEKTRVATVYYKPDRNKTKRIPDYYIHRTNAWLIFPHELEGLSKEEIREMKGETIAKLLG